MSGAEGLSPKPSRDTQCGAWCTVHVELGELSLDIIMMLSV